MECFQGSSRFRRDCRSGRCLSKASAKVQLIFELQNFFRSFFRRNFATFRHCAEFQIFDARKNFQHFGNIFTYGQKTGANKEKFDKKFLSQTDKNTKKIPKSSKNF